MNSSQDKSKKVYQSKRIPLGRSKNKLVVHGKEDGYVYRVVNDTPGRVQEAQAGGYEITSGSDIEFGERDVNRTRSDSSVAKTPVGGGVDGYLMRIKEEYYEEDKKARQAALDEQEASMRRELNNHSNADYGKFGKDTKDY